MSILGKTTSMFYLPPPKMPKDNKTDVSVFGKWLIHLNPPPTPIKTQKRSKTDCSHAEKRHIKRNIAGYRKGTVSNFISMPPL